MLHLSLQLCIGATITSSLLDEPLIGTASFIARQHIRRSIFLNLCWHLYDVVAPGVHLCLKGNWLSFPKVLIHFFIEGVDSLFSSRLKHVELILSHVALLPSLFALKDHLNTSRPSAYLHSTPSHSGPGALRRQPISKEPKHSNPSESKPLSLFGARLHYKSTFNTLPQNYAQAERMRLSPSLRYDTRAMTSPYVFGIVAWCSRTIGYLCR